MKKLTILLILLSFFYSSSFANDTVGTVAASGIEFTKTASIKMLSEELSISPTQVKVAYLFKNITDKPISATVYFPLPAHKNRGGNTTTWDDEVSGINNAKEKEALDKNAPFRDFSVTVNGKPIECKMASRAVLENKDITHILIKAGIPLNPEVAQDGYAGDYDDTEDFYTNPDRQKNYKKWLTKAKNLGLLDAKNKARWEKQIVYYWQQTFPANQTIAISHTYKPAAGVFYGQYNEENAIIESVKEQFDANLLNYDDHTQLLSWARDKNFSYFLNVKYILRTGANWAGPIEKFTLNLIHPDGDTVAYNHFYNNAIANITHTSDKTQISLTNFTPNQDLNIIFAFQSDSVADFLDSL